MKRLLTIAALSLLAVPAALAVPPESSPSAAQLCRQQQRSMSAADFAALYPGSKKNAFARCVASQNQQIAQSAENAAKWCKAQRGASAESIATFNAAWGDNENKRNAMGKCVSATARGLTLEQQQATLNAAKTCRKMRASDRAAFEAAYGTKKNAFGKCVAAND
jgi:hypothetical protein